MSLLVTNSEGKTLYAIVCERTRINRKKRELETLAEIIYTHAETEGEARWIFGQDNDYKKWKIIGVAPAIGFHANDDNGDSVTA